MEDVNLQPLLKTKRQQVSRACGNCRKAKTACSNHRPCQRCVKFNLQSSCEDAPRKQRANPDTKKPKSPRRTTASPNMSSGLDDMEMDEPMANSIEFLQNGIESYQQQPQYMQQSYTQQQYYPQQPQQPQYMQSFQNPQPFPQPIPFAQYIQQQPQFQQHFPQHNQPTYPQFQTPQPVQAQTHFQSYSNQQTQQTQQTPLNQANSSIPTAYQMNPTSNGNQTEYTGYVEPPKSCNAVEENPLGKLSSMSGNISFGSAGSLHEFMQMRTPSLETLIVTVNSEITKKNKKEDSFSSIPI